MALLDVSDALVDLTEAATVTRHSAGSYVSGRWIEDADPSVLGISVSAQPYRPKGDEDWLLQEGEGSLEYLRFFSTDPLKTAEDQSNTSADIVQYKGNGYKILNVKDYKLIGNYYEAIGVQLS